MHWRCFIVVIVDNESWLSNLFIHGVTSF